MDDPNPDQTDKSDQSGPSKDLAKLDQLRTFMVDHQPKLWRGLYNGLIAEGFSEPQAFTILLTYVSTSCKAT
jgi:hypothetical protein